MRICHISSGHHFEGSGRIFSRACRGLVTKGHTVTLIINREENLEETVNGVLVIPLSKKRKGVQRYLFAAREAYLKALQVDADIYHFHDPELLPWMVKLQKRGRKVIFDSHEHFTEVLRKRLNANFALGWLPWAYHFYQKRATNRLSGLIGITEAMIDAINPQVPQRCAVGNFVNLELFDNWQPPLKSGPPIIATSGLINTSRHCGQLVDALPIISRRHPGVILRLSGQFGPNGYREELIQRAAGLNVQDQIELLGYVTYQENVARAAQATVGCAFFEPKPYARVTLQNRLFEYMFCGVPVLVSSNSGVTETIVRDVDCGCVVDSLDPESIAGGVCRLLDDPAAASAMGQRGRQAVLEKYNFGAALKDMIAFYERILDGSRS